MLHKILLSLLIGASAAAQDLKNCKDKSYLVCDGQEVIVRNKKKKAKKAAVKPVPQVAKEVQKPQIVREYYVRDETRPNTLYVFGYDRHVGTDVDVVGSKATVNSKYKTVFGVGYMRHTESSLAVGAAVDTKGTVQLAAGVDF